MENAALADRIKLLSQLLDIQGQDPFRAKSYAAASFAIDKLPYPLSTTPTEKLKTIRGIGSSVAAAVEEMLSTGRLSLLDQQLAQVPAGVVEMLQIKGIGPKKIHTIWKEMGIESIGELLYACQENRLTLFKGFGEKTQQSVAESIRFYLQHQGHFLYAEVASLMPAIEHYLQTLFNKHPLAVTGAFRRQEATIEELEFVVGLPIDKIKPLFVTAQPPELLEETTHSLLYRLKNGLRLRMHSGVPSFARTLLATTGSVAFLECFESLPNVKPVPPDASEADLFDAKGLPYIIPCRREDPSVIEKARLGSLTPPIEVSDIKALIHCHSNWSDGSHTIEQMAEACRQRGWEYMVLSDHSASAFYANGLLPERVLAQHEQIDALNSRLSDFYIFKSIESDILTDGSLDYPQAILERFDLVIASVHSQLTMSAEKANARLIKAIENPYTRILGHLTGRLLLSRKGYPVDHELIIDACAANGVAIELNAHPRRLDLDWRWIDRALSKGVLLSINPDAHAIEGLDDIKFGVSVAQKTGLGPRENISSFSVSAFREWLLKKRG